MATKGKRSILQYSEESLQNALAAIRYGGCSILGASVKYGVPRSTIQDRMHGRVLEGPRRMGPPTILTKAEEERLENWCNDLAKCGFPLKIDDLLNTVQLIIKKDERTTPFANDRPGRKWFANFLKRHPSLALREAEGISKGRAVITEESIRKWFDELKSFLRQENALDILDDPDRIFNGDETSFCMCPKTGRVIAPKGYRNVYSIQRGNEKETVTVLLVFSASGKTVDPMVVFPYVRVPKDIVCSLPDRWFLGKSETGWMVSETFYEYVANCVHNWLSENNIKRPILLFVDGHKSHMTLELSEFCDNNQIILYALPPNTTHIMQPADVSVFKPLKSEWKKTLREWHSKPENSDKVLSKSTLCPLLHMILSDLNMENTIKNGFRKCGLYPFNADNVDFTKCVRNRLEELASHQKENTKGVSEKYYDKAIEIINLIRSKLCERGIDSNIVIDEIRALKNGENVQNIEILDDVTIQPGTYIINDEGVLEMERRQTTSPTSTNYNDYSTTPTSSRKQPICEVTADCASPNSSICSTIIRNVLCNSISSSPTGSTVLKNPESSVSPSFASHLHFPKPSSHAQIKTKTKAPSAISALAWREHIKSKENEKIAKAEAVKERKLEREKRKKEKGSKPGKFKKLKRKQICSACAEELDSDAEDDALKNVGCDTCPLWYHLKCTEFKNLNYSDVIEQDFVCKACTEKSI